MCSYAMGNFLVEKRLDGKQAAILERIFGKTAPREKILGMAVRAAGAVYGFCRGAKRGPGTENLQKLKLKSKIFLFFNSLIYKFAPETDYALTIGSVLIVVRYPKQINIYAKGYFLSFFNGECIVLTVCLYQNRLFYNHRG